ncbi:carcinoembryonic antigen-related cell adhesion molecule 1-like [Antennarius striatus]|uniref:carcinoembryonic antigen-related cell adhesion molecule 1-like n=1 Tax=Antennarius striatus TaxID=241820 RepID=UPI0035AEA45E
METLVLLVLVIAPGVWSRDWEVIFYNQCVLRRSVVVIKCEYDYPRGHIVTGMDWYKVGPNEQLVPLSELQSPTGHFKYVGNYQGDCSLQINDVQQADTGKYYFHFSTILSSWMSKTFFDLHVQDLKSNVQPSIVAEGESVRLTCHLNCSTTLHVVWFRDGQPVWNPVFQAKREDAGKYYCAVWGRERVQSDPVALNVQYAPNKMTLSMTPSGDVVRGSSVTFTCHGDANPPVTRSGYALYKDGRLLQSGQNYTISDIQPGHSGWYRCHAWNNVSWRGSDLFNSTDVQLDVQYRPENVTIDRLTGSSSINLTCSSTANPAADSYTWFMRSDPTSSMLDVGSGQTLFIPSVEGQDTWLYICQASNRWGAKNSSEMPLISQQNYGNLSVSIIAGIGVLLFVALLLALLFWRKLMTRAGKKVSTSNTVSDLRSHKHNSSANDDPNSLYVNHTLPSYRPAAESPRSPLQHDAPTSHGNEIVYSSVTFSPRHPSRFKAEANTDSVIYAAVVTSN